MAATLSNSIAVVIVYMRPRAIPEAMITLRKSIHGFPSLSYMSMVLCLQDQRAAGAPLSMVLHLVALWAARATILLLGTNNSNLWVGPTLEVLNSQTSAKSYKSNCLTIPNKHVACSENWIWQKVAILDADQPDCSLWGLSLLLSLDNVYHIKQKAVTNLQFTCLAFLWFCTWCFS